MQLFFPGSNLVEKTSYLPGSVRARHLGESPHPVLLLLVCQSLTLHSTVPDALLYIHVKLELEKRNGFKAYSEATNT